MRRRTFITSIVVYAAVLLLSSAAQGASPDLVLSQVFAGGGNAGASYANDYVELFNRGNSTVDLSGWTIQYATASGTTWSPTALAGTVSPGGRHLVQLASGGANGAVLPAPDSTGTTNLSTAGGKLALVHDVAALTCGAAAGSCSTLAAVHDLVGYGAATDYEGAAAPALTNTTAAVRADGGCVDTDSNAADFIASAAVPRNAAATAMPCAGSTPTASQTASVAIDVSSSISLTLERASVSLGTLMAGDAPAPVSERVTVVSNDRAGYALSVRRTAFAPVDLPLGVSASAPAGAQLSSQLAGATVASIPTSSELLVGTTSSASATGGDVWPTNLAFTAPLPVVAPGHYSASVVYTVIGG
ncbi:MAG: lamin tail domain-containing protein [Gaiellaceae bacterium]